MWTLPSLMHVVCIMHLFLLLSKAAGTPTRPLAPALYVFGDSLFDAGNNNLLSTLAKANFHPYGVDLAQGPTGRFTNGKTVPDFIAEYLGLPYPPPIIGLPTPESYMGFNYASAACGILDESGSHVGKCLNLKEQIILFNDTVERVLKKRYTNQTDLSLYLSESIFVFSIGSNDYLSSYLDPTYLTTKLYSPRQFSNLLLRCLSLHLKKLYKLGATKVLFFELGPIGCIPHITRTTQHSGQCNEEINGIISMFNDGLGDLLSNLTFTLQDSHFVIGKVHELAYDAITNPTKYGLTNSKTSCCRAGLNNTVSCIPELPPCESHDKYYFWDAYHLTEAMYSILASRCINDSSACFPLTLQQLVQL